MSDPPIHPNAKHTRFVTVPGEANFPTTALFPFDKPISCPTVTSPAKLRPGPSSLLKNNPSLDVLNELGISVWARAAPWGDACWVRYCPRRRHPQVQRHRPGRLRPGPRLGLPSLVAADAAHGNVLLPNPIRLSLELAQGRIGHRPSRKRHLVEATHADFAQTCHAPRAVSVSACERVPADKSSRSMLPGFLGKGDGLGPRFVQAGLEPVLDSDRWGGRRFGGRLRGHDGRISLKRVVLRLYFGREGSMKAVFVNCTLGGRLCVVRSAIESLTKIHP